MGHQTGQARGSGHGTATHSGRTGRSTGQRHAWPRSQLHQACTPEQPAKHPGRRTAHVLREMTRAVMWSMRYWSKSWALAPDYRRKGGRGILFLGGGGGSGPHCLTESRGQPGARWHNPAACTLTLWRCDESCGSWSLRFPWLMRVPASGLGNQSCHTPLGPGPTRTPGMTHGMHAAPWPGTGG